MIPDEQRPPRRSVFQTFWMGGFECACQINSAGVRLDMTAAVQHDIYAAEDYRRLRELGIGVARDGVRWHLVDRGGELHWGSWTPMIEAARQEGVQVIWDLCHYGWPDDIDVFSGQFVSRFAKFCGEAARIQLEIAGSSGLYAPVNEISFFAWGATRDLMFPYAHGRDCELKRQLVRASIAAIDAVRSADPAARFVFPEPLIHNVPTRWRPWQTGPACAQRESQFEAWDMIAGRREPELGGQERYLDIVGVNYYAANQWEMPGGRKLHWDNGSNDPRWRPLRELLAEVWERYRRPMIIAETSHYGVGRADWINEIGREVRLAMEGGVPLEGVCLYPILDRFDWDDRTHWHNSGLWDMHKNGNGHYHRVLNEEYAEAFRKVALGSVDGAPAISGQDNGPRTR